MSLLALTGWLLVMAIFPLSSAAPPPFTYYILAFRVRGIHGSSLVFQRNGTFFSKRLRYCKHSFKAFLMPLLCFLSWILCSSTLVFKASNCFFSAVNFSRMTTGSHKLPRGFSLSAKALCRPLPIPATEDKASANNQIKELFHVQTPCIRMPMTGFVDGILAFLVPEMIHMPILEFVDVNK